MEDKNKKDIVVEEVETACEEGQDISFPRLSGIIAMNNSSLVRKERIMDQDNKKTVDVEEVNMLNEEEQNISPFIRLGGKYEM